MNIVEEIIEEEYIKDGFLYNNLETFKNENGTFRKITLETGSPLVNKIVICFEYIRLAGHWACSSTATAGVKPQGAYLGKRALTTQIKVIRALEKMDKE